MKKHYIHDVVHDVWICDSGNPKLKRLLRTAVKILPADAVKQEP